MFLPFGTKAVCWPSVTSNWWGIPSFDSDGFDGRLLKWSGKQFEIHSFMNPELKQQSASGNVGATKNLLTIPPIVGVRLKNRFILLSRKIAWKMTCLPGSDKSFSKGRKLPSTLRGLAALTHLKQQSDLEVCQPYFQNWIHAICTYWGPWCFAFLVAAPSPWLFQSPASTLPMDPRSKCDRGTADGRGCLEWNRKYYGSVNVNVIIHLDSEIPRHSKEPACALRKNGTRQDLYPFFHGYMSIYVDMTRTRILFIFMLILYASFRRASCIIPLWWRNIATHPSELKKDFKPKMVSFEMRELLCLPFKQASRCKWQWLS